MVLRKTALLLMLFGIALLAGCSSDDESVTTVSSIDWISVAAGNFYMGSFSDGTYPEEEPLHTVYIDAFQMSRTEITNAQYVMYLNEALEVGYVYATTSMVYGTIGNSAGFLYCDLAGVSENGDPVGGSHIVYDDGIFIAEAGYENYPVTFVSWYGAYAYTQYLSAFYGVNMSLPTEAEWEYVARGDQDYGYPTVDGTLSCVLANYACGPLPGTVTRVANYSANPLGLHDLAGNVREWCWDWYDANYYDSSPTTNPVNLAGAEPPQDGSATGGDGLPYNFATRVVRGGSYLGTAESLRSAARDQDYPFRLNATTGFRVVLR